MEYFKSIKCPTCRGMANKNRKCKTCSGEGRLRVVVRGDRTQRDQDIVAAYRDDGSIATVADQFGLSNSRVHQIVGKLAPEEMKKRGNPTNEPFTDQQIIKIKDLHTGKPPLSLNQLAKRYGVTVWAIRKALAA